jgi:branched-chain amino acid transport system substrate-binding protein
MFPFLKNNNLKIFYGFLMFLVIFTNSYTALGDEIETVNIGVIFPIDDWMELMEPAVSLAKEDINNYMIENEYNYRFEFIYKNANFDEAIHLDKLVELKEEGVDLVIGCIFTMFANQSVPYANENDMIIISPSSTGSIAAIEGDNFFRLTPTDYSKVPAVAEIIWDLGDRACIYIGPDNLGEYDETNRFEEIMSFYGVDVSYATYPEEIEDIEDFKYTLEQEINKFRTQYDNTQIGIYISSLCWGHISSIANFFIDDKEMEQITWYTSEELNHLPNFNNELDPDLSYFRFYFPSIYLDDSAQYREVNERYIELAGSDPDINTAAIYDTCWLYAFTVLEAESQSFDVVKRELPFTASTHEGITGTWLLDETGDRLSPDYTIMGLVEAPEITFAKYGYYDTKRQEITWIPSMANTEAERNPDINIETNGPFTGKVGYEIFFSAEGSYLMDGDIFGYRWSFGDGAISYEKNPSHIYYLPGEYLINLRVIDSEGRIQEYETNCMVRRPENVMPVARAQAEQPYYCYVNESLDFSSTNSYDEDGTIIGVVWDFADGETSNEPSVSHTFKTRDLFEVTLTVTDDFGGTHTDTVKCYVMSKPSVQIEGPYTRSKGELITFNANVVFDDFDKENTVEEYEWSLEGSFSIAYEETPSHIFSSLGTFPVSVKITDYYGDEYRNTAEFGIEPAGITLFGYELSIETLRDYSGWILGTVVAFITILGAGTGAIKNVVRFFTHGSEQSQFYDVLKKRMMDMKTTYESDPARLTSELIELKDDLLNCMKDKSISLKHYTQLDKEIDEILEENRKKTNRESQ